MLGFPFGFPNKASMTAGDEQEMNRGVRLGELSVNDATSAQIRLTR
jgi:hypothetical protein